MAYTAQIGGVLNVEGSFNDFFITQLTAKGVPSFLSTAPTINLDYPVIPLTYPSFSITQLGSQPIEVAQGRNLDPGWKGAQQVGLAQIDCWESYQRASGNHIYNIRVMRDMAARVFATGAAIPILDVYGTTGTPTANGTLIRAMPAESFPVGPDPNPDVIRARLTVQYNWLERTTAG